MSESPVAADLPLRGPTGVLQTRIYWSASGGARPSAPKLLVFFPGWTAEQPPPDVRSDTDALCARLCERSGAIVLMAPCRTAVEAISTIDWAAEHATDLGADQFTIAITGDGAGAELAEQVTRQAAVSGWPHIEPFVLSDPDTQRTDELAKGITASRRSRPSRPNRSDRPGRQPSQDEPRPAAGRGHLR